MSDMAAISSKDQEHTRIRKVTQKCRDNLRRFTQVEVLMENHWAENRLSEFNLWDASTGASVQPPNSLDLRLRYDPQARKILLESLEALFEWTAKCLQLCVVTEPGLEENHRRIDDTAHTSGLGEIDQSESPVTLEEGKGCVEELLAILIDMGTAIRQAGTASRLRLADRTFHKRASQYNNLKEHLTFLLLLPEILGTSRQEDKKLQLQSASVLQPDEEDHSRRHTLQREQEVLLQGNVKRRDRFAFALIRANELGLTNLGSDPTADAATDEGSTANQKPKDNLLDMGPHISSSKTLKDVPISHIAHSVDTSNQLSAHLPNQVLSKSKKTRTFVPATTIADNTEYPEPPTLDRTRADFCPYCWLLLTEDSVKKPQWK
ncbi:hypothetical protein IG631_02546 [Alternaria alternata]|nr:hypothetical protein IG631_02546 [Alternaria alternata]